MYTTRLLSLLTLLALASCQQDSKETMDLSSHIVGLQWHIVPKAADTILIDGKADDKAWDAAKFSESFIDIEGVKTPKYETQMKMLWDDDYLYVFAEMEEPHVWGDLKQRDTVIFYNNDFEVFLSPSGTTMNYGEIEINALGTVWDLLLDKPYRVGGKANNHWNLDDLKSAVSIRGTLNDPSDTDIGWSVELAIPMKALLELKDHPKDLPVEGEQWRVNFSRVNWDHEIVNGKYYRKKDADGKFLPEYNWVWSNQNVINMHEPEKWGVIQFTEKTRSIKIDLIQDPDMLIEQLAFALFRETNFGSLKHLLDLEVGKTKTIDVRYFDQQLDARYYRTNMGFEYTLTNPETGKVIVINEMGDLKK